MKEIVYSTKAKRDLKRCSKNPLKMEALYSVLHKLSEGKPLPARCKVHNLIGQYNGCQECHIGNDFLLIWIDDEKIRVMRIGNHSELFR